MTFRESKLPLREMLAYGCGDFASVLYWHTFMRYLPYFYTDVFGLSAGALATMLLLSRIWDGINDPIVGIFADRTDSRWGKFRPYLLYGCGPFAFLGVLTFTTPDLGATGKLIWAYVTYNGLMMLYTVVNIPYTSLMGVMTSDPIERARLSSIKFIFAFSAGMVISAALLPLVTLLGGAGNAQRGWQLAFIVVGAVAVCFFLITVLGTRERIAPPNEGTSSVRRDLKLLLSNHAWLLLTATTLTWILFVALRSSVSTHYFKYYIYGGAPETSLSFLGRSFSLEALVSAFNVLGQAASVLGVFATTLLVARLPKRAIFICMFGLSVCATGSYYFLKPGQLGAIFVIEIFANLVGAPLPVLLWAMYADTADYGEWKSGRRTTALVFSASTMSQKFGWALAAFFAFRLLEWVGFRANVIPTDAVKTSLVRLMSVYPAVVGMLSIAIFFFYPLNEKRMNDIDRELRVRRAEPGS